MARVQPPGKMPGRRRWLQCLLGACLAAAVVGWPAPHASASVAPPPLPPPTGLNVTAADSSQVSLSWTAPTAPKGYNLTGYNIYAGTSSGGESPAGNSTTTSYTVTGLTSGTTYYFYVTATAAQSCLVLVCPSLLSLPSSEVSATTSSPTLAAPTGLTATAEGSSQIGLSWTAPAPVAGASITGYKVYDGTSSGGESPAGNSSGTSYTVTGLTSVTTYYFEVTAVYQSCSAGCPATESSRSGEVSATTDHGTSGLKSQVIDFGRLAPHLAGVRFTVSASASSELQVSFGSDTPRVCSVSGSLVRTVRRGKCTIMATQAGNADYAPAPVQTQSFRVKPVGRLRPQTITFARPADVPTARRLIRLSASASSGLPVSFRSDTPSVCSVSGQVVTTVNRGKCTITAIQAGNTHYAAAANQTRSFQVGPVPAQVPRALIIVLTVLVLAALVLAAVAGAWLLRRRPPWAHRPPPPPRVRAEPHPDSPGTIRLRVTGPDVCGTVRIEPHQATAYSRLERAQR